jgi:Ca-activated chloride channel family protein
MNGFPLDTAKGLLRDLIRGLKPTDSFNVLLFAGGSQVMSEKSTPAVPAEIRKAMQMIDNSRGGGGTELLKAMNRAMALPRREGVSRTMVLVTDGYINADREVFESIQKNLGSTNVFAFGIGSSVNRYLIEGLAKAGQGEPFVVTTPAEAGPAARKFREYIASPVLTDMALSFSTLETYDVEPAAIPDMFSDRPVVVFGKFKGDPKGTIELSGKNGEGDFRNAFDVSEVPFDETVTGLDYLWARSRIAHISDFNPRHANPENREEIVSLGLTYNLLTAFTSFVAVDEIVRNPDGNSKDAKQPLPLPKGVSNLAVGGMNQVPEPELVLMGLLMLGLVLIELLKRKKSAVKVRLRR